MRITVRPLNDGETICCTVKKAKEIFGDTDVTIDFAYYDRHFGTFANTKDRFYVDRYVKGRVVASMYAHGGVSETILGLYVVKKVELTEDLRQQFENVFLEKFYEFYQRTVSDPLGVALSKCMLVELYDGKFKVHEFSMK